MPLISTQAKFLNLFNNTSSFDASSTITREGDKLIIIDKLKKLRKKPSNNI
jgi:hypothetical protein